MQCWLWGRREEEGGKGGMEGSGKAGNGGRKRERGKEGSGEACIITIYMTCVIPEVIIAGLISRP